MYTQDFAKWLFNYLESNSTRPEEVYRLLEQCNYCDTEANLEELAVICRFYEKYGEAKTRAYVATAVAIQSEDLEPQEISPEEAANLREAAMNMPTPKGYVVVSNHDPEKLQSLVNGYLSQGMWHLAGGVSVAVRHEPRIEVLWSQALYRYY